MTPAAYISDIYYIRLDKVIGLSIDKDKDTILVRLSEGKDMVISREEGEALFVALSKWQVNESQEAATATAGWPDKPINWAVEKTAPTETKMEKSASQVFEELMAKAPGKRPLPMAPGMNYSVDDPSLSRF